MLNRMRSDRASGGSIVRAGRNITHAADAPAFLIKPIAAVRSIGPPPAVNDDPPDGLAEEVARELPAARLLR
jgi:hypothetical protein